MSGSVKEVVLTAQHHSEVLAFPGGPLTPQEVKRLRRLVTVAPLPGKEEVLVRRNAAHRVGKCRVRNYDVVVPPELPSSAFVQLLLYALGADSAKYFSREAMAASLDTPERADFFLRLIGALLVRISESQLTQRIARTYEPIRERSLVIRGRPVWTADFGGRRSEGITCDFRRLSEDNLLNRIVLAGLIRATILLKGSPYAKRSANQLFVWRTITAETDPREDQYRLVSRRLTRITEHYRPAVALSRALVLGYTPEDPFTSDRDPFQGLDFSLPAMYELLIFRFLRAVSSRLSLSVDFQPTDRAAIVDGTGDTYRSVRPDVLAFKQGRPVCVIDAKYKPRYVSGPPFTPVPQGCRVSNDDLYQLFFYQMRAQHAYGLGHPPPGAIIAPVLEDPSHVWDGARRRVEWRAGVALHGPQLTVIPFPLINVLERLAQGETEDRVVRDLPELIGLLTSLDGAA